MHLCVPTPLAYNKGYVRHIQFICKQILVTYKANSRRSVNKTLRLYFVEIRFTLKHFC